MSDASQPAPRKFTFDTAFDGARAIGAQGLKRLYTAEEVERLADAARAEGEAVARKGIEGETARALAELAEAAKAALPLLAAAAHEHRIGAAQLALACARQIADAACERFPDAPLRAAFAALAREVEATPRLVLSVAPGQKDRLQAAIAETAEAIGYPGQIILRDDPDLSAAAFVLDWGDGSAAFDPAGAALRIAETLEGALAAEGLHAEALSPDPSRPLRQESSDG